MSEPNGSRAEDALRGAESEERQWYARMVRISLISSGASLVLGPGVIAGDPHSPAPFWTAAGFAFLAAGWLASKILTELDR